MPKFKVRASSVAEFFDCPERWAAKHLDGKTFPSSAPAAIGTAVHAGTAVYDEERLQGHHVTPNDAADIVEELIRNPKEEVDWGGLPLRKALQAGIGAHTRYCEDIAPRLKIIEVERALNPLEVTIPIDEDRGVFVTIELTGTLDRILQFGNQFGVGDIKTGARVCSQSVGKHKAQMGVYELLAENSLLYSITAPAQIIKLQTSTNYQVALDQVHDARTALLGNEYRAGWLVHMARMLMSGDFYGNPGSQLCLNRFCPQWEHCLWR